jgi:hypothetical protein
MLKALLVMSHHMVTMRPKNSIIERVAGSLVAGIDHCFAGRVALGSALGWPSLVRRSWLRPRQRRCKDTKRLCGWRAACEELAVDQARFHLELLDRLDDGRTRGVVLRSGRIVSHANERAALPHK